MRQSAIFIYFKGGEIEKDPAAKSTATVVPSA